MSIPFELRKQDNWQAYEQLVKEVGKDRDVSILINNAEEFDKFGSKIHRAKDEEILGTLTINTFPMVFMTRFLGAELKKRQASGNKSAIINMTSYYSDFSVKNAPIFSSTKAFEDVFS